LDFSNFFPRTGRELPRHACYQKDGLRDPSIFNGEFAYIFDMFSLLFFLNLFPLILSTRSLVNIRHTVRNFFVIIFVQCCCHEGRVVLTIKAFTTLYFEMC